MVNDYLSLVEYITRPMSIVLISFTTYRSLCSIEIFFNVFQVYELGLHHIWRYFQIVRASLILCRSRCHLYSRHICMYGLPIINFYNKDHLYFIYVVNKFGA
jgi:hypothetical protein